MKAPVDGIAFVGAKCEHIVLANHTITAASGLERKWLHDPSGVEATVVLMTNREPSIELVSASVAR